MTRRRFLLAALTIFLIALPMGWVALRGKVALFTLDKQFKVEVNGIPVRGEILDNRFSAVVTIRGAGNKHSYQLFYSGDVDRTGDMGFVVDCRQWVAPHFPILLQTPNYPPCKRLLEDKYWSLTSRGRSMQFVTKDHSTISIVSPD